MDMSSPVRGRFAPSPTGPLHFGSLIAALGSYLQARSQGGEWYLRIENLDPPREQPGASDAILRVLDKLQLHWDGEVMYQSTRLEAYEAALSTLARNDRLFYCDCSRQQIRTHQKYNPQDARYPGTCRSQRSPRPDSAIRVQVDDIPVEIDDLCQGRHRWNLAQDGGDFIVRRRDGLFAYHLAVVVDDAYQGMTEIVRGSDLLDSTPGQVYLQHLLGLPAPAYMHLPVATRAGIKLSKQAHAPALNLDNPGQMLLRALHFLGQAPPASLCSADAASLLEWAVANWQPQQVPGQEAIEISAL